MLEQLLEASLVYVKDADESKITLDWVEVNDRQIRVASANNEVSVVFALKKAKRYLTLTIQEWQGVAEVSWRNLFWQMKSNDFYLTELDYMSTLEMHDDMPRICWLSPSHHFGVNPSGAFAAFQAESDEDHDAILMNIWVEENQPHPEFLETWNEQIAGKWLSEWQQRFTSRSQMVVNADSLQELYEMVPYAEKAGIDEIYLFTNTWRPDPFWPVEGLNWSLNKKVFPNGRKDLRAYSDHLAERGMRLNLHYVSGGFGLNDPQYISGKPHPELASWGTGKLLHDVDSKVDEIRVSLFDGIDSPTFQGVFFNAVFIQIGDEIIHAETIDDAIDGTLTIKGCKRGSCGTVAVSHADCDAVKFLVVPYAQNFVPDNDSDLLYEVADNFASLLNECNIGHAEFDGAEIHCYNGRYGYMKFAQRIYEKTDHAITSHDSMGSTGRCFFEYRFKSTNEIFKGTCRFTHGNWLVPFQVDSLSRPAATALDAHFFLSQGHYGGSLGLSKPEPMFGVTTEMLAQHGLTNHFLESLHSWKEISKQLTDEQHQMIEDSLTEPIRRMPEVSRHRTADTVFTVEKENDSYSLRPVQVMCRKEGDVSWTLGQEYGPISPRQFIQPGEELELYNKYEAQVPNFQIRVLQEFDLDGEALSFPEAFTSEGSVFEEKDFFVEGNVSGSQNKEEGVVQNINLLSEGSVLLEGSNDHSEPKYQVRQLPEWGFKADLSNHTGIALEIEGDGSGALVVVQLEGQGCRDYVFPVDFTGVRTVVVPNGEVSWARADWGWRMGVKSMDYAGVEKCHLGLGMIPGKTAPSIKINRMVALSKKPTTLQGLIVEINGTRMQIMGCIETGNYISYKGGDSVEVVDANWNLVEKLPILQHDLKASEGKNNVRVISKSKAWLEVQFLVKDKKLFLSQRCRQ